VCATVIALATALEGTLIYVLAKDILFNALRIKIQLASVTGMIFAIMGIALTVAGLTVLAYRRNVKKVINK
jgi:nitrate reductase gamma subunit